MSLVTRFKKYLEEKFRTIKPTREAMEYREEVLSTLLDRTQDMKDHGVTDEDYIYNKCIEDLGDFDETLKMFEQNRINLKKVALKTSQILLIALSAIFIVTVAFLTISLVTKEWSKTWLLEVGGIMLVIVGLILSNVPIIIKRKKYLILRAEVSAILIIMFVIIYLALVVLLPQYVSRTWLIFFGMIVMVLFADCSLAYSFGHRNSAFVDLLLLIALLTTFLYVSLGLLGVITWSIYWILPVAGVAIDFLLIVIKYCIWYKKKKEELDDKYYTTWKN